MSSTPLITSSIFSTCLFDPAAQGADHLIVVSGYASPAMATRHFNELRRITGNHSRRTWNGQIDLLVGMAGHEGMDRASHQAFRSIAANSSTRSGFSCHYNIGTAIHSKIYVWLRNQQPTHAWVGSANYTQRGLGLSRSSQDPQREAMSTTSPEQALEYASCLWRDSLDCRNPDVENQVPLLDPTRLPTGDAQPDPDSPSTPRDAWEHRTFSLLRKGGTVHTTAGLNWGQRESRNPNEAYIPIPTARHEPEFFPPRGEHFTVMMDDGEALVLTRGGDNGKQLTTPLSNAHLGEYMRHRLGVAPGDPVHLDDLTAYGRSDVTFYRLPDGLYFADFSPA